MLRCQSAGLGQLSRGRGCEQGLVSFACRRAPARTGGERWGRGEGPGREEASRTAFPTQVTEFRFCRNQLTSLLEPGGTKFWLGTWSNTAPVWSLSVLQTKCCVLSRFSCVQILCDPIDCSPPGSSGCGILQARLLEWVAVSTPRGSSRPRDRTRVRLSLLPWQAGSLSLAPAGKPAPL